MYIYSSEWPGTLGFSRWTPRLSGPSEDSAVGGDSRGWLRKTSPHEFGEGVPRRSSGKKGR